MSSVKNRINLVNSADEIVGQSDKIEAHLGKGLLHQAVSLFLFRRKKNGRVELLMQERSTQKIVGALQWANTVCGNVAVGENHRECVLRRLQEELGLSLSAKFLKKLEELLVFRYQVQCNQKFSENEIDHIFGLIIDEEKDLNLVLDPLEVKSTAWVDWDLLKDGAARASENLAPKQLAPWFALFLASPQVILALEKFLKTERN